MPKPSVRYALTFASLVAMNASSTIRIIASSVPNRATSAPPSAVSWLRQHKNPLTIAQVPAKPGGDAAIHGGKTQPPPMSGASMGMKGADSKSMDMKGMMKDNNDKMSSLQMTGNPDVDFASMMRIHHPGAINMANAELRDGKEPKMRAMAKNIIAAQKKEIAQFDRFLAKQGSPAKK